MDKHSRAYRIVKAAQENKEQSNRLHELENKQELVRNWLPTVNKGASTSFNSGQLIQESEEKQPLPEWSGYDTDDSVKDPDYHETSDSCSSATSSHFTPGT